MILLEPVGLDSRIVIRHLITARGSDCSYPRAVLSLEQGALVLYICCIV